MRIQATKTIVGNDNTCPNHDHQKPMQSHASKKRIQLCENTKTHTNTPKFNTVHRLVDNIRIHKQHNELHT